MISGKLQADFSSFEAAVSKAEVSLRGFETGAGKVETSLNKMANSLSGTKLIQDATLMSEAVDRVGGVSKLTASELQRVSAQAKEAAAKLVAMGQDVPPGIQKIADATKGVGTGLSSMGGALSSVAGAFGVAFSVGAVVNFGKSVFEAGGKINDMSKQMGISTDAVQGFKEAAELSGSSLDAVGTAIGKMNANLAGGDKATVKALKDAGLGFSEIRSMKPEDAFLTIADAIQKMDDPMKQVEVGRKLMGKGFDELLPAMKEGFRATSDAASKMSKDTIESLDKAGDAWQRLANKVTIITGNLIASAMDGATQVTSSWKSFTLFADNAMKFGVGTAFAMAEALEKAQIAAKKNKDTNLELPKPLMATADALAAGAAAAKKFADELAKWSGAKATADMKQLDAVFRKLADSGKITRDQVEAIAKEAVKLQGEGATLTQRLYDIVKATDQLNPSLKLAKLNLSDLGTEIAVNATHAGAYVIALAKVQEMSKTLSVGNITFGGSKDIDIGKPNLAGALKAVDANTNWVKSLADVTRGFDLLASSSTGSMSRVLSSIGDVTNALSQASSIMTKGGPKGGASHAGTGGILTPFFDADASGAEKWGAAIQSGATVVSGAMSVWSSTAQDATKGAAALHGAMSGAKAGAAFGPYGMAVGAVAGAVAGMIHQMTIGRRTVEDFAKSFDTKALGSGFDELHTKMLTELGMKQGEEYWIKLTQGVKKNDKAGAQAVIDSINDALTKAAANDPAKMASAAGFQTLADLQEVADKAEYVYDYMLASGKYSASELARAFQASADAQKAALGDSAKSQQDALDAITDKYKETIDKIDSEMKSLSDSIAKEAPEEFMGIVEAQERARLEDLKNQKSAQEAMRDAEIAAKKSTFDEILDAGKKTYEQLRELFGRGVDIPYNFVPPSGSGGGSTSGGQYYTPPKTTPGGEGSAVHVYIGNQAVDDHVLRVVRTRTPGDLMVRGR